MNSETFTEKKRKIVSAIAIVLLVLFSVTVGWFIGKPLIDFVSEPIEFRNWVNESGIWGRIAFVGMVVFQVVIALLPGEPFEIGAGYAFGIIEGTVLCVIGITIGSLIVFTLVKRFGVKLVEVFFDFEKIRSLKFLQNKKKLNMFVFLLFFLPGTPKDLLTYFLGLTSVNKGKVIFLASVARLPSVITSILGGSALVSKQYVLAVIVFAITLAISLFGYIIYDKIIKDNRQ